jgi:hypothetical protein
MGRSTQAGPGEESPVAPGTIAPGKTDEEVPQAAAEPAPDGQPATPPDGAREFSSRRPGRGNRLRRGLRSRRKSLRQS